MQVIEIEKLSPAELRQRADAAFVKADEKGPSYLMEAQFYMQELSRREGSKIARRDFRMELMVILLIGLEIVIALYEGHEQATLVASQTKILQNLQTSTKNTADATAEELAIQYRVFVNVQPSGRSLSLINNSKNEVTVWGIKVDKRAAKLNRDRSSPIAEHTMVGILLDQFYPTLFSDLPQTGSVILPIVLYLKSADNREYVVEGNFTFSNRVIVSGQGTLRAEKWSDKTTFS